jgi:hypothetical protein
MLQNGLKGLVQPTLMFLMQMELVEVVQLLGLLTFWIQMKLTT